MGKQHLDPPPDAAPTTDELVDVAVTAQRALSRAIHAMSAGEWQTIDLTMPQMKALLILDTDGQSTIGELACRMGFGKPAMSILVEKLVQGGYLHRTEDPEDRRRTIVRLSEKGADVVAALLRGTHSKLRGYLSQLRHEDLVALVQGYRAVLDVITPDMPEIDPCRSTVAKVVSANTTSELTLKSKG